MERGDWWITRITDNRVRGLVGELCEAIAECEDPETVYRLRSTLSIGLANFAARKERELRQPAS